MDSFQPARAAGLWRLQVVQKSHHRRERGSKGTRHEHPRAPYTATSGRPHPHACALWASASPVPEHSAIQVTRDVTRIKQGAPHMNAEIPLGTIVGRDFYSCLNTRHVFCCISIRHGLLAVISKHGILCSIFL